MVSTSRLPTNWAAITLNPYQGLKPKKAKAWTQTDRRNYTKSLSGIETGMGPEKKASHRPQLH